MQKIHDHGTDNAVNDEGRCQWQACHTNTYNGVYPVTETEPTDERKPFSEIAQNEYFFLNGNAYKKASTRTGFLIEFQRSFYIEQNATVHVAKTHYNP